VLAFKKDSADIRKINIAIKITPFLINIMLNLIPDQYKRVTVAQFTNILDDNK
jgi:hypothetical protein